MYAGFKRIAPDQDTGMDLNEPWIPALELFNPGGGDLRGGHLRNQLLTSTTEWANLFLRSAIDLWTYCHKSIDPGAQTGTRALNRRRS
jgi:hypothetical protein